MERCAGQRDGRRAAGQLRAIAAVRAAWLGNDQLQLQSLRVAGSCAVDDGRWQFKRTEVELRRRSVHDGRPVCLAARGGDQRVAAIVAQRRVRRPASGWPALTCATDPDSARHPADSRRGCDRSGTCCRSTVRGQTPGATAGWQAQLETSELAAVRDGRRFTWRRPAAVPAWNSHRASKAGTCGNWPATRRSWN